MDNGKIICCPLLTSFVSGSPIVQNGKLVGAVTHVIVNNISTGYGIYIEDMYEECLENCRK